MKILLLGKGKTGSLVEQIAVERGHSVTALDETDNQHASALTPERLADVDVAVDFTTAQAALENVAALTRNGKNIIVGTTGWYSEMEYVRSLVTGAGTGLVWGANFSVGVNLFFDVVRAAAPALLNGYYGQVMERHHVHKKDAPSGTAIAMQNIIEAATEKKVEIASLREGETVGMHVLLLDSPHDSIMLTHDAKSRRGFAEGAVRAAEWLDGRTGFYDFKDIWRQLS